MIQGKLFGLWYFQSNRNCWDSGRGLAKHSCSSGLIKKWTNPVLKLFLFRQIQFWERVHLSDQSRMYISSLRFSDRKTLHRIYPAPMARWRAGSLSTTTFRMGPELRLARLIYFSSCISFLAGCLSQVLPQGRPQSDEGELRGRCVPCKCHQVCIGHFTSFSV